MTFERGTGHRYLWTEHLGSQWDGIALKNAITIRILAVIFQGGGGGWRNFKKGNRTPEKIPKHF